jgi:hypothetical protein
MPRKPSITPVVIDQANPEAFEKASHNLNQLVLMSKEQDTLVREAAVRVGYQLPANATDPDLIQRDISANMRRSVEACLEVGKGLTVLKAACAHGEFLPRLDALGIEARVAQKFMAAAGKFANASSTPLLKSIDSQTKLFEMLVLDDEALEELATTGQTGELTLDDVATMSVKDLRNTIRSLRGDLDAKDKVLDDTQKKLTRLQVQAQKKVAADTDWPDALMPITDQIAAAGRAIAKAISDLETCRITLMETGQALEADLQPKYEAALGHIVEVYEAALGKAERDIQKERVTFDKSLGAYGDVADTATGA